MKYYSLRTKLFLYSMVFCFTGVVIVGAYSFITAREALIQRTYQQLISLREEKRTRLETFYSERIRDLNLISSQKDIVDIIYKLKNTKDLKINSGSDLINHDIIKYLTNTNAYYSISFALPNYAYHSFSANPASYYSSYYATNLQNTPLLDLFQRAVEKKRISVSDLSKGAIANGYSSFIANPVYTSDSILLGVVFLEISQAAINSIIAEQIYDKGLGQTGEVYLVGSDNLLRSSSRFFEKSILQTSCNLEVVTKAQNGESGFKKTMDYRDHKVLSAFGPVNIPDLKWIIVAEIDYDEAIQLILILGQRIFLISIIVFVFLTVGVFFLSKRITAPLVRLKQAAKSVGDGRFEQTLPIVQHDEIGVLTQVFNKMILQLNRTTTSLKEREQRLTHFYKATIDGIVLHKTGSPVLVNDALSNLTGYSEEELIKKSPMEFLLVDDDTFFTAKQNPTFSFEAVLKTKTDKKIPVEVQKNRILFHGQEVESLVIRDISQRKAIEQELQTERLRQMRSVIDGQEQERQRLSRELHDGLGQILVAIKLKLESIPLEGLGDQRKMVESVKQMFNQTIEDTRRMSNNLMPAALTEFSLAVVLRNLCMEVESNSGINVSLVIGVLPESFNQLLKTYVYRIAQEALNNIVKHSGASRAVISIFSDISKLYLHIEDDGVGFDTSKGSELGNGLYNMKERAILLNGKLEIISSKGNGVKIQAEFPIFPKQKG